jgi:2-iminobutanoate/2-iminopropanoate deaminase
MSSAFQSISTGTATRIGKYADAVRIPAGAEVIPALVWPNIRVEVEVTAIRTPAVL